MDLKRSMEFSSSTSSPQVYGLMPVASPFIWPNYGHQAAKEDDEETKNSHFMQKQKEILEKFWGQQMLGICNTSVFKYNHPLPLTRIKKIMKSNGDVTRIGAETPMTLSKACEMFILELTLRAWLHTEGCSRQTLERCDIGRAVKLDESFHFLFDVVPFGHSSKNPQEVTSKTSYSAAAGFNIYASTSQKNSEEVRQEFMMSSLSDVEFYYGTMSQNLEEIPPDLMMSHSDLEFNNESTSQVRKKLLSAWEIMMPSLSHVDFNYETMSQGWKNSQGVPQELKMPEVEFNYRSPSQNLEEFSQELMTSLSDIECNSGSISQNPEVLPQEIRTKQSLFDVEFDNKFKSQ